MSDNSRMTKATRLAQAEYARQRVRELNADLTEEEAIELAIQIRDKAISKAIRKRKVKFKTPDARPA